MEPTAVTGYSLFAVLPTPTSGALNAPHAGHSAALEALLYLPLLLVGASVALQAAADLNISPAARFLHRCLGASSSAKSVALLLAVSATVHAGLVPVHWRADLLRAVLFGVDACAMTVLAGAALLTRGWHPAALLLLLANLLAYALYVSRGWEALEPVGVATFGLELVAVILVVDDALSWWGRRMGRVSEGPITASHLSRRWN